MLIDSFRLVFRPGYSVTPEDGKTTRADFPEDEDGKTNTFRLGACFPWCRELVFPTSHSRLPGRHRAEDFPSRKPGRRDELARCSRASAKSRSPVCPASYSATVRVVPCVTRAITSAVRLPRPVPFLPYPSPRARASSRKRKVAYHFMCGSRIGLDGVQDAASTCRRTTGQGTCGRRARAVLSPCRRIAGARCSGPASTASSASSSREAMHRAWSSCVSAEVRACSTPYVVPSASTVARVELVAVHVERCVDLGDCSRKCSRPHEVKPRCGGTKGKLDARDPFFSLARSGLSMRRYLDRV